MSEGIEQDNPGDGQATTDGGLVSRLELIESQPLEERAARFDQLAEEMLAELQRSDNERTNTQ